MKNEYYVKKKYRRLNDHVILQHTPIFIGHSKYEIEILSNIHHPLIKVT